MKEIVLVDYKNIDLTLRVMNRNTHHKDTYNLKVTKTHTI